MSGSAVSLATVAVSAIAAAVRMGLTSTDMLKITLCSFGSVGIEHVTVPAPPASGVEQVAPSGAVALMNVVSAGTRYVSVTFFASAGPVLITSMDESIRPPGGTLRCGPIVSEISAVDPGIAVIAVSVVAWFGRMRSGVSELIVA